MEMDEAAANCDRRSPTLSNRRTRKGIIHRDIKPANIFLTERGTGEDSRLRSGENRSEHEVASTDSGATADAVGDNELTSPGTAVGTVSYMSPEQARGQACGRAHRPIFDWNGAVPTGDRTLAFQGETSAVIFDAILNRDPRPRRRELNPSLPCGICAHSRQDRSKRTASCAARRLPK